MQLTTPSVPAIAVSTAITIFKISFQSSFTMIIYNLTNYKLQFIYILADFIYDHETCSPPEGAKGNLSNRHESF